MSRVNEIWEDVNGLRVSDELVNSHMKDIGKTEEEFMAFFEHIDRKHHLYFLEIIAGAAQFSDNARERIPDLTDLLGEVE